MKNESTFLHTLPMMQEFTYYGKKVSHNTFPSKNSIVTRSTKKREVLDLTTMKTVKLPYFTNVKTFKIY
jgi:hypothetical protein